MRTLAALIIAAAGCAGDTVSAVEPESDDLGTVVLDGDSFAVVEIGTESHVGNARNAFIATLDLGGEQLVLDFHAAQFPAEVVIDERDQRVKLPSASTQAIFYVTGHLCNGDCSTTGSSLLSTADGTLRVRSKSEEVRISDVSLRFEAREASTHRSPEVVIELSVVSFPAL